MNRGLNKFSFYKGLRKMYGKQHKTKECINQVIKYEPDIRTVNNLLY